MSEQARHLPALDGIRALACAAVVAYHVQFWGVAGGWVGVDLFFVLSGYLITGILLAEKRATGEIDLRRFYLRRAGRLYPALIVMVVLSAFFFWTMATPGVFAVNALLALTYTSDLARWFTTHGDGALSHTWSLAVEEQFYLLWPLILLRLRSRRAVAVVAAILCLASLSAMTASGWVTTSATYFGPHARAWEVLAGACLAARPPRWGRRGADAAAWSGLALVGATLAVVALTTPQWTWAPQAWPEAFATVVGSLLLIAGLTRGSRLTALFSLPAMQWIGQRTYGIYLFHVPVRDAMQATLHLRHTVTMALIVLVTIVIAAASFRWIEVPVRDLVRRRSALRRDLTPAGSVLVDSTGAADGPELTRLHVDGAPQTS